MIYIAADHAGFSLKEKLLQYLKDKNIAVEDCGAYELNLTDDYPDIINTLVNNVLQDISNKGIAICKNGVGVSIVANRAKNIRAGISWSKEHAASQRTDDDTNVLALPAEYISEEEAKEIVDTWLATPFSNEEKHIRRLKKYNDYPGNL